MKYSTIFATNEKLPFSKCSIKISSSLLDSYQIIYIPPPQKKCLCSIKKKKKNGIVILQYTIYRYDLFDNNFELFNAPI